VITRLCWVICASEPAQPAGGSEIGEAAGRAFASAPPPAAAINPIEPHSGREPSDLQLHSNHLERLVTYVLRVVDRGIHVNDLTGLAAEVF
jgi:hypothetical protein